MSPLRGFIHFILPFFSTKISPLWGSPGILNGDIIVNVLLTGTHKGYPYIICGHFYFSKGQLRAENFLPLHHVTGELASLRNRTLGLKRVIDTKT
jgi:hypothetical protein